MKFSSVLAFALLVSSCATGIQQRSPAASRHTKLGIANCMKLNSTVEIFECLDATYTAEDNRLNNVYNELTALLKNKEPERFDKVRRAQLAWIRMRDSDCDYESSVDGAGEASGAADSICKIKSTIDRRADLELRLGDLKRHLAENSSN